MGRGQSEHPPNCNYTTHLSTTWIPPPPPPCDVMTRARSSNGILDLRDSPPVHPLVEAIERGGRARKVRSRVLSFSLTRARAAQVVRSDGSPATRYVCRICVGLRNDRMDHRLVPPPHVHGICIRGVSSSHTHLLFVVVVCWELVCGIETWDIHTSRK